MAEKHFLELIQAVYPGNDVVRFELERDALWEHVSLYGARPGDARLHSLTYTDPNGKLHASRPEHMEKGAVLTFHLHPHRTVVQVRLTLSVDESPLIIRMVN